MTRCVIYHIDSAELLTKRVFASYQEAELYLLGFPREEVLILPIQIDELYT